MVNTSAFSTISSAIDDLRAGKMVILVDDEDRENEGDLILAAEKVTPESINFMSKYGRGLICLSLIEEDLKRLQIPMMVENNTSKFQTAFTVSIEAASGVTTGISAFDRAHTIQMAIDSKSTVKDIVMPGHIFPLRAQPGGVLARNGQTEGSVDLAKLAGLKPAAVLCEIMKDDGSMARLPDLITFAKEHHLKIISIKDLIAYRVCNETLIEEIASARLPLPPHGEFLLKIFSNQIDNYQHIALIKGPLNPNESCLVRLHSECLTGDVFGSSRCDCGWQLESSINQIGEQGGVLLYMRQEGRGIGLVNKVRAYALQDSGLDTVDANHKLGFSADSRNYGIGAQILHHLGVNKIRLLTNNPEKLQAMTDFGIDVEIRESLEMRPTEDNLIYLNTKREKLGHLLNLALQPICQQGNIKK